MRGLIGRGGKAQAGVYERARREALYEALEDELFLQLQGAEMGRAFSPDRGVLNDDRRATYAAWLGRLVPYEDWTKRLAAPAPADGQTPDAPVDADVLEMTRAYHQFVGAPAPAPAT